MQKQMSPKVNAMGGPELESDGEVSVLLKEEVGMAYGVGVTASGAPEIGTYVGTCVGVGMAVACATNNGGAPTDSRQAESSPSVSKP